MDKEKFALLQKLSVLIERKKWHEEFAEKLDSCMREHNKFMRDNFPDIDVPILQEEWPKGIDRTPNKWWKSKI